MSRNTAHLAQLDGLRAIAVGAVVFYHYVPASHEYFLAGRYGVRLFFVISGFLITGILLRMRSTVDRNEQSIGRSLRQFYVRRFLRIFPLYYAVLLACQILDVPSIRWHQLKWHLAYLSNVFFSAHGYIGYMSHFWSLSVEEQFYLIWPLLLLTVRRSWLPFVMLCGIAMGPAYRAAAVVMGVPDPASWILTPGCVDALALGALLAWFTETADAVATQRFVKFTLVTGVAMVLLTVAMDASAIVARFRFAVSDLAAALLFTWVVARACDGLPALPGRVLEWRPIAYLGKISYGIYVYHFILPYFILRISGVQEVPYALVALGMTAASIAISALSWEFFEGPINQLKDRFPYVSSRGVPAAAIESRPLAPASVV